MADSSGAGSVIRVVRTMKARSRISFAATVLLSSLLLSIANTPAVEVPEKPAVAACLHLLHDGRKYSLSYSGQTCIHQDHVPLPEELYDALASWAFNASHAKILSEFDRYRVLARLA